MTIDMMCRDESEYFSLFLFGAAKRREELFGLESNVPVPQGKRGT